MKVADVAPLAIMTEEGAGRPALLDVNPTVDGAGNEALSATEQLPEPPDATVRGVQVNEDSVPSAANEIVNDSETPFSIAVMEAVEFDEKVPACAVNVAVDEPVATVIVWGTESSVLLLESEIETVEPAGAGSNKVRVQSVDV